MNGVFAKLHRQYVQMLGHWRFFRRLRLVRLREIAIVGILGLAATVAELGGLAMIIPILSFIEHGKNISAFEHSSYFGATIVRIFSFVGMPVTLFTLSLVAFTLIAGRQVVNYFNAIEIERIKWNVARRLSVRAFAQIMGSDATNIRSHKASDFSVIVDYECNAAAAIVRTYGTMWTQLLNFAVYGSVLVWSAPLASFLAGAVIAVLMVSLRFLLRIAKSLSVTSLDIRHSYMAFLNERFRAWRLIKLAGMLSAEVQKADELQAKIVGNQIDVLRATGTISLIFVPVITMFLLGTVYVFVEVLHIGIATLVLFVAVMIRLVPVSQALQKQWILLAQFAPALDRVRQTLEEAGRTKENLDDGRQIATMDRGLEFERVSFRYPDRDTLALSDVSLVIPARTTTALIGASGAGKSTLVDLIPRLIDPTAGRIMVDGVPLKEISLRSLRKMVAYVPQEPFLFDASVTENIRYGRQEATDEDVADAARLANASEFVTKMPNGFATLLGEGGAKLSGGQKQRIALARAFLANAQVIILDEPTSALDLESESAIQHALEAMVRNRGRTVLIIAHRFSTIRHADFVVHLKDGRLLNAGSADMILRPLEKAGADAVLSLDGVAN
jgi:ATP-binding cassette, subfamily B, bacterial MsbA